MPDVGDHPAISEPVEATPLPAFDYDALEKGEQIGTGGDANVYEASLSVDGETHRLALKEPRFEGTVRTETFDRFEEEAETWANLDDHKNIVTVHGYGAGSVPWIALEYMDGGTLADKVEDIDFEEALWPAGRIAEGVRHGHRHGIVHLDLKPSNVLIRETPDGKWNYPKVSDWGLAKMLLKASKVSHQRMQRQSSLMPTSTVGPTMSPMSTSLVPLYTSCSPDSHRLLGRQPT